MEHIKFYPVNLEVILSDFGRDFVMFSCNFIVSLRSLFLQVLQELQVPTVLSFF